MAKLVLRLAPSLALFGLVTAAPTSAQCGTEVELTYLDAGVSAPLLRTPLGAPVLGGPFGFRVHGGPADKLGVLFYSGFEDPLFDPVLGATVWPQLPWFTWFFGTGPSGDSPVFLQTPEITDDLCGVEATFQAVVLDDVAPAGVVITNAVRLRVGDVVGPVFGPEVVRLPNSSSVPTAQLARGDMDGNGTDDLVTHTGHQISVVPALRSGGFGAPVVSALSLTGGIDIELGDLDGDADLDAVYLRGGPEMVAVLNDGAAGLGGAVSYTVGSGPRAAALADLDLDGDLDAVVANSNSTFVSVLSGSGAGAFAPAVSVFAGSGPGGSGPQDVAVGDLNEDGLPDLVAALLFGDVISFLPATGPGVFGAPVTYSTGSSSSNPGALVIADFDGDAHLDVASVILDPDLIEVRRGDGTGALTLHFQTPGPASGGRLGAADLNGDGVLDLAALDAPAGAPGTVKVALGLGDGSFQRPTTSLPVGFAAVDLALFDADGDGDRDLCVSRAPVIYPLLEILDNDGSGTFDPGSFVATTTRRPSQIELVDVNGDRLLDTVTLHPVSDSVEVRLALAGGGFGSPLSTATALGLSVGPITLDLADLTGDGKPDLVVLHDTGELRVWRGTGTGLFIAPVSHVLASTARRVVLADVDGDSDLDILVAGKTTSLSLLLNDGSGVFSAGPAIPLGLALVDDVFLLELARVDAGPVPDVVLIADVVASGSSLVVRTLLGNGDGTYGAGTSSPLTGFNDAAVGDLDGDGLADLATTFGSQVSVYLADGAGGYPGIPLVHEADTYFLQDVRIADLDGDGRGDVLALSGDTDVAALCRGLGDGTFSETQRFFVHAAEGALAIGDLDDDGVPDLATAGGYGSQVEPGVIHWRTSRVGE